MEERYNIMFGNEIIAKDMDIETALILAEAMLKQCTTYENAGMVSIYEMPKD